MPHLKNNDGTSIHKYTSWGFMFSNPAAEFATYIIITLGVLGIVETIWLSRRGWI